MTTKMTYSITQVKDFVNQCFKEVGVEEEDATAITETMIKADLRGIHSHGLMRLPVYIKRFQNNYISKKTKVVIEKETNSTALLDGCHSAGQVVGAEAMNLAIKKAADQGIGGVAVKNSNHFGIAAHFAQLASSNDMIGLAFSNTTPLMPPIGGKEKVLGNNPIAIAIPTSEKYPIVLDMALSNVALGKILFANTQGSSIPKGWGIDKNGDQTTDPSAVLDGGFILPVGGPKGFGLALVVEVLTGILSGGDFSKMIPSMMDQTQKQSISHFMLAIDISHFMPISLFKERMKVLSSFIKEAEKADGIEKIYLPGEIEFLKEQEQRDIGFPIDEKVVNELKELADSLHIPFFDK